MPPFLKKTAFQRLKALAQVQIPEILHHLSTERVITMEFVRGAAVCDREALQRMGVKPNDVAKLVSETFNEMIFTFGDVRAPFCSCVQACIHRIHMSGCLMMRCLMKIGIFERQ